MFLIISYCRINVLGMIKVNVNIVKKFMYKNLDFKNVKGKDFLLRYFFFKNMLLILYKNMVRLI